MEIQTPMLTAHGCAPICPLRRRDHCIRVRVGVRIGCTQPLEWLSVQRALSSEHKRWFWDLRPSTWNDANINMYMYVYIYIYILRIEVTRADRGTQMPRCDTARSIMYACVCIYVYIYIYMCIHKYIYVCVYIYIYICTYIYIYTHVYIIHIKVPLRISSKRLVWARGRIVWPMTLWQYTTDTYYISTNNCLQHLIKNKYTLF